MRRVTWLDRAIGSVAPRAALRRVQARESFEWRDFLTCKGKKDVGDRVCLGIHGSDGQTAGLF